MNNSAPAGNEYVYIRTADYAGGGSDPYLAVTVQMPGFACMF